MKEWFALFKNDFLQIHSFHHAFPLLCPKQKSESLFIFSLSTKEWKKPFELLFCSFALKQELFAWKPKSQFPTLLYSHFLKLARMHSITPPYWMYINPKSEKTPEPEPIKKGLALLYQHCSQYCITVIYIFCKIKLISSLHTLYYAL